MKIHVSERELIILASTAHAKLFEKEKNGSKAVSLKQRTRYFEIEYGLVGGSVISISSVCISRYWLSIKDIPIIDSDALHAWLGRKLGRAWVTKRT